MDVDGPVPMSDSVILAARPPKNPVDPWRPYAYLVEDEHAASGKVEPVATVFLTNRECPFRCLMCDLWKNTTDSSVPLGAIPAQIRHALDNLPPARHVKLYNSGNFFDRLAIPVEDHAAIAQLVQPFDTVIVESHPRLCGDSVPRFRDRLTSRQQLEVAMGLETIHPRVLPLLNKHMTCDDFAQAARRLVAQGIAVRCFILLRPPTLTEQEGVDAALDALGFAFDVGVRVAAIIPVRAGNGILEQWAERGWFEPPTLGSLEYVLEQGLAWGRGRVFVDLWDVQRLKACPQCRYDRYRRLERMNLTQQTEPPVECSSCAR